MSKDRSRSRDPQDGAGVVVPRSHPRSADGFETGFSIVVMTGSPNRDRSGGLGAKALHDRAEPLRQRPIGDHRFSKADRGAQRGGPRAVSEPRRDLAEMVSKAEGRVDQRTPDKGAPCPR